MKKILNLIVVAVYGIGTVYGQVKDPDTTAKHFIIMASIGNLQEVNAGKLAAQKATKADVKSFAKMMVTDHTELEQKLIQLAQNRGYKIPAAATEIPIPDPKLGSAPSDDLDRMYIHSMVAGHRTTVMMFQNYAIVGKDPKVKAFAQQMLPTLRAHLAAIKDLDEKYKKLTAK